MDAIKAIENDLKGKSLGISSLDKKRTALVVIDMINGFVYKGALSSLRVAGIVKDVAALNEIMSGCRKVFFIDSHGEDSAEFCSFPAHCVKNSDEAELIPELVSFLRDEENSVSIEKNSTNGFLNEDFQKWLNENMDTVDNYIVAGCVTDICILQFTLSMKAYFNEKNMKKRVIVPMNCVETYHAGTHDGYLTNLFALYNMHTCGIEIVEEIKR